MDDDAQGRERPELPVPYIGLSLDVGRKAFSVEGTIGLIRRMGELGLTALHLHLTETDRVGIALPGFEELAAEDAWTARDAARLVAAAEEARVTLVPEIDLPSHAAALLVGREHLRLVDRHGTVHPDRLDISLPEARQFALDLLGGAARLFPGEWLHLGGDEFFAAPWEDEEARRPDRFPSLVDHARAAHGPEATALDCYADFMNVLAARALELGRTPILWNDHVVPAREAPLVPITTEAVLDVWIRWREWTPSVTDYLDSGYRVLNSNGDLLYMVLSADDPPAPTDGAARACSRTPSPRADSWAWPRRACTSTSRLRRPGRSIRCSAPRCPCGATPRRSSPSGRSSPCWTPGSCPSRG